MRYIIYGAGGIGGCIGARLFQHGHDVILIARGAHLRAMQEKGLILKSPIETVALPIPCVGHPSEIEFREEDVVIMTMKSQHSTEALEALRDTAGEDIPVICGQNGVDNERMAARRFSRVYGMVVFLPASHLEPGIVLAQSKTLTGVLDVGCFPTGTDAVIEEVAAALSASNFSSKADPRVMRYKYSKMLGNLYNALQALCGPKAPTQEILGMMRQEGIRCYEAAGIDYCRPEEVAERRRDLVQEGPIDGQPRGGSSSWQSITRGTGSIESDYLNGEIVLLGKLYGVPTPANRVIQRLANKLARERGKTASYSVDQVKALIMEAGGRF